MRSIRRKLELSDRRESSSENRTICLPDFSWNPEFSPFFTLSSLNIIIFCKRYHVIHFRVNAWQFFITHWMNRHRHFFPRTFRKVSAFTLTSITARFGTQLQSVLLTISYCKVFFSFPLHLPHLTLTYVQFNLQFFQWIRYWYPLKIKNSFLILVETTEISPAMINLTIRWTVSCLPFKTK